jgi:hypothetical protein
MRKSGEYPLAKQSKIADKKLQEFVTLLVNAESQLPDSSEHYFFQKFKEFFPSEEERREIAARMAPGFRRKQISYARLVDTEVPQLYYRTFVKYLKEGLQAVWEAGEEYTAEWRLFWLRSNVQELIGRPYKPGLEPPPIDLPIQQALHWLRQRFSKLKKCANPDCSSPFFIAGHGKQQYCSDLCAHAATLESRRKWFREHGAEWRKRTNKKAVKNPSFRSK